MPSQYRHGESTGLASVQMQSQFSYAMPCTPQAHCRYEPALSYHGLTSSLTPLSFHDTESWILPGSFEKTTRNGSPQELYNFQQPAELPMGSADDGVEINVGTSGVFPLTEIRSESTRWSPPMSSYALSVPTDIVTSLHGGDVKPAVNGSNMGSSPWIIHEVPNPVTVAAEVDLNAPITTDAAAPATGTALVVRCKAPRPSSSAGALGAPKVAKTGSSRKGVRGKAKSMSAPASPSELRRNTKSLSVQKSKKATPKPDALRVVSQRENHIWSERERRKGMNYLFNTLRSLLPHPVDKVGTITTSSIFSSSRFTFF